MNNFYIRKKISIMLVGLSVSFGGACSNENSDQIAALTNQLNSLQAESTQQSNKIKELNTAYEIIEKSKEELQNEIIKKEEKIDGLNLQIEEIKNGPKRKLAEMELAFNEGNYANAANLYAEIKDKHLDSAEYEEALKIYEEIRAIEKKRIADAEKAIAAAAAEKKASLDKIVSQNNIPTQVDSFTGTKFYLPDRGNEQSYIRLYVAVPKSGAPYLRLNTRYDGEDWVFFDKVYLSYEGNTVEVPFNEYDDKTTKVYGGGRVYENIDVVISDSSLINYLKKYSRSPDAKVRFSGDFRFDKNTTAKERTGMVQALWVLDAVN
jgi:hypothetical protein